MGSASAENPSSPKTKNPRAIRKIFTREKIKNAIAESAGMGGWYFI
jgi:hypothetical protein